MTPARGGRIADAILAAAMVAVPLASSSAFSDPYTTVKWYLVHVLAAVWLLVEVWVCRSAGWPAFVRRRPLVVGALAALAVWSALRGGPGRALGPLADRGACAALALCAAWHFARNRGRTLAMAAALALSAAATIAIGFAQAGGRALPTALAATEGPAALFGNVNMAAQFVGLALVLVLATPAEGDRRRRAAWNAVRLLLAAGGALYLYLLSSRSVLVALAVAALCLAWDRRSRRAIAATALVAALLALVWSRPWAGLDPALADKKATSIELRLAVWADTVAMIRDRPLGVGAGNFEHAFLPYQARGRLQPQEALVFRGPHNEYLRFLAEDGVLFCAVAAALVALLAARWRRSPAAPPDLRALVVGWGSFLAVEAAFQFPLALAFGALAAAIAAGGALAGVAEGPSPRVSRRWWMAGGTLASAALLAASFRVSASESLYAGGPDDLASQRRACALDPRNLPACVTAAWLEVRGREVAAAKERLHAVLAWAPHYPPALKLLGEIAAMEGSHAEACRRLTEYDALFRGQSTAHADAVRACAEAR
jgi:O-antigen ligase